MEENWYALAMAICSNVTVASAVKYCKYGIETKDFKENFCKQGEYFIKNNKVYFSESDIARAIEFKKTHSWKETSEYFGINVSTLRKKILKTDTKAPTKVDLVSEQTGLYNKPLTL